MLATDAWLNYDLVINPTVLLNEKLMKMYQMISFCSLPKCLLKKEIFETLRRNVYVQLFEDTTEIFYQRCKVNTSAETCCYILYMHQQI